MNIQYITNETYKICICYVAQYFTLCSFSLSSKYSKGIHEYIFGNTSLYLSQFSKLVFLHYSKNQFHKRHHSFSPSRVCHFFPLHPYSLKLRLILAQFHETFPGFLQVRSKLFSIHLSRIDFNPFSSVPCCVILSRVKSNPCIPVQSHMS
jgi:hypothetical protein